MEKYFLIGDVSKMLNIPKSTLRYYDEKGILSPEIKGENGYRYYSGEQLIILKEIKMMRNLELSLAEIKKVLNSNDVDDTLEMLDKTLVRIREEINSLELIEKRILDDMRNYHNNKRIQLNIPFVEKLSKDKKGMEIYDFKDKKDMTIVIKKLGKLERKNYKILNNIIRVSDKDLEGSENSETSYVVLEDEKQNNRIAVKKGKYVSIYGKGAFREEETFKILKKYIREKGLKRKDDNVYISFQVSTLCWKKEDMIFKMKISIEE